MQPWRGPCRRERVHGNGVENGKEERESAGTELGLNLERIQRDSGGGGSGGGEVF